MPSTLPARTLRRPKEADIGASTYEYVGLIALAAVTAALLVPLISGSIRHDLSSALCRIFLPGARCPTSSRHHARNYAWGKSECTRTSATQNYGLRLDVDYFSVHGGVTFMKSTTADGHVHLTALDSATLNGLYSQGPRANWGRRVNVGASQEGAAGVKVSVGDTWNFSNEAQAQRFQSRIKRLSTVEAAKQIPLVSPAAKVYERLFPTHLPRPDITRQEVGVQGHYSAGGPLSPGNGKNAKKRLGHQPRREKPPARNVTATPSVILAAGAHVESKAITEHDRYAGTNSVTYNFSLSASANAGSHRKSGGMRGTMKVTRDVHGRIVDLRVASDYTHGGSADVVTFDLRPENDGERAVVEHWLTSGDGSVATNTPLKKILGGLGEADRIPDISAPYASSFDRLLYQKGRFMKQAYGHSETGGWNGGGAGDGPSLGLYFIHSGNQRRLRSAQYLGAPDSAGVRHFKPFVRCR